MALGGLHLSVRTSARTPRCPRAESLGQVEQVKADKHARNERQVKELQYVDSNARSPTLPVVLHDPRQGEQRTHSFRAWIETTLGEKIQGSLIEALKDGQVLCRLINKIAPNTVKKINKEASPFKQRVRSTRNRAVPRALV